MRRSWKALIVATAVLLATVGVMSLATASTTKATTLAFTAKTIQSTQLDHHPHGFSQGDEAIFAYQLLMGGKAVGLAGVTCTVVHAVGAAPGPESHQQCVGTFDRPGHLEDRLAHRQPEVARSRTAQRPGSAHQTPASAGVW